MADEEYARIKERDLQNECERLRKERDALLEIVYAAEAGLKNLWYDYCDRQVLRKALDKAKENPELKILIERKK